MTFTVLFRSILGRFKPYVNSVSKFVNSIDLTFVATVAKTNACYTNAVVDTLFIDIANIQCFLQGYQF